jgi:branched-chain amino acid transport system ATP-binding protein
MTGPGSERIEHRDPVLAVDSIVAGYGANPVITGISFELRHGEVLAVLGANGAGKSTLARTLMGLLAVQSGSITMHGKDITRANVRKRVHRGMSLVTETRDLFPGMRVDENLALGRTRQRESGAAGMDEVLSLLPVLRARLRQQAGTLSGGEQQMLAVGRALMSRPAVLILDEPSLGLAPRIIEDILGTVRELADGGKAILLIEQNAELALEVADRGMVMSRGAIEIEAAAGDLARDNSVRLAYFGETAHV